VRKRTPGGHFKKNWVRLLAVAAAMSCMSSLGVVNFREAGHVFQVRLGVFNTVYNTEPVSISEHPPTFVERWWQHFKTHRDVDDAHRPGRPPKIPNDVALHAAEILCRGYTITRNVDGRQIVEQKFYSTLPEAVGANAELRAVLLQYSETNEQLLHAVHRVAPEVEQRRVSFRHMLSPEEKTHRSTVAAGLLTRYQTDPTLLDKMVFIDETTLLTHGLKREHIKVWVNGSDTSFKDYTSVPGRAGDPVKAHVIAAVSAHPAFQDKHGLVYFDFTTGTSFIKRLENKRQDGSTPDPRFVYTVSIVTLGE
jgi:hypothetical protein